MLRRMYARAHLAQIAKFWSKRRTSCERVSTNPNFRGVNGDVIGWLRPLPQLPWRDCWRISLGHFLRRAACTSLDGARRVRPENRRGIQHEPRTHLSGYFPRRVRARLLRARLAFRTGLGIWFGAPGPPRAVSGVSKALTNLPSNGI